MEPLMLVDFVLCFFVISFSLLSAIVFTRSLSSPEFLVIATLIADLRESAVLGSLVKSEPSLKPVFLRSSTTLSINLLSTVNFLEIASSPFFIVPTKAPRAAPTNVPAATTPSRLANGLRVFNFRKVGLLPSYLIFLASFPDNGKLR